MAADRRHHYAPDQAGDCVSCPLPQAHPVHQVDDPLPETPYAGTSGWAGSQTSRERAESDDADGMTSRRQRRVLRVLRERGTEGATWREVAVAEDLHHGQASGALSALHKAGQVARLAEVRRERCSVYCLPEFVGDRETAEHGKVAADPEVVTSVEYRVVAHGQVGGEADDYATARQCADVAGGWVESRTVIVTPWNAKA